MWLLVFFLLPPKKCTRIPQHTKPENRNHRSWLLTYRPSERSWWMVSSESSSLTDFFFYFPLVLDHSRITRILRFPRSRLGCSDTCRLYGCVTCINVIRCSGGYFFPVHSRAVYWCIDLINTVMFSIRKYLILPLFSLISIKFNELWFNHSHNNRLLVSTFSFKRTTWMDSSVYARSQCSWSGMSENRSLSPCRSVGRMGCLYLWAWVVPGSTSF